VLWLWKKNTEFTTLFTKYSSVKNISDSMEGHPKMNESLAGFKQHEGE